MFGSRESRTWDSLVALSTINLYHSCMIKNVAITELQNTAKILESILDREQILFGQAIVTATAMVESNTQRSSLEDVVDLLYCRFNETVPKQCIESNAAEAIEHGIAIGLFEQFDQETFVLTEQGTILARTAMTFPEYLAQTA